MHESLMETKEQSRERGSIYRQKYPERKKESARKYREANRQKLSEYERKYREENWELRRTIEDASYERNLDKRKDYRKEYYERNKRRLQLKQYGLTEESFSELLQKQDGFCYLCEEILEPGRDTVVDHNHETGIVRGLAHRKCNLIIGQCKDDPIFLRKLADNLERASK